MPLPIIADVTRCGLTGLVPSGQRWANVWHFIWTAVGSPTSADVSALDVQVNKLYSGPVYAGGNYWLQHCTSAVTLDQATYTALDGSTASQVIPHTGSGGSAGDSVGSGLAVGVSFFTGLRGADHRGRVFLPTPAESNEDSAGRLNAANVALMVANYNGFMTAIRAINWDHVVASYLHSTASTVTGIRVNRDLYSQRRRRN